jgi:hypothetical protein
VSRLRLKPLTRSQVNRLILEWHRHHKPVPGYRFAIGAKSGDELVGAIVVGRPVAHMTEQYEIAEATRCVTNGHKNACSFLYAAAARAAEAMGFYKIQTFLLEHESGVSLKAAGWTFDGYSEGGDWNRPSRGNRRTDQPQGKKQRWIKILNAASTSLERE